MTLICLGRVITESIKHCSQECSIWILLEDYNLSLYNQAFSNGTSSWDLTGGLDKRCELVQSHLLPRPPVKSKALCVSLSITSLASGFVLHLPTQGHSPDCWPPSKPFIFYFLEIFFHLKYITLIFFGKHRRLSQLSTYKQTKPKNNTHIYIEMTELDFKQKYKFARVNQRGDKWR